MIKTCRRIWKNDAMKNIQDPYLYQTAQPALPGKKGEEFLGYNGLIKFQTQAPPPPRSSRRARKVFLQVIPSPLFLSLSLGLPLLLLIYLGGYFLGFIVHRKKNPNINVDLTNVCEKGFFFFFFAKPCCVCTDIKGGEFRTFLKRGAHFRGRGSWDLEERGKHWGGREGRRKKERGHRQTDLHICRNMYPVLGVLCKICQVVQFCRSIH